MNVDYYLQKSVGGGGLISSWTTCIKGISRQHEYIHSVRGHFFLISCDVPRENCDWVYLPIIYLI